MDLAQEVGLVPYGENLWKYAINYLASLFG
jgi:hypothetical protein